MTTVDLVFVSLMRALRSRRLFAAWIVAITGCGTASYRCDLADGTSFVEVELSCVDYIQGGEARMFADLERCDKESGGDCTCKFVEIGCSMEDVAD